MENLDHWHEVAAEIIAVEVFLPEYAFARLEVGVKSKTIHLILVSFSFNHQSDGVGLRALWSVRNSRRKEKNLDFS